MRVASIGWLFGTGVEVRKEAEKTALPTHNHPEGIKGAVATAEAIFLARKHGRDYMLKEMEQYYPIWKEPHFGSNKFDETCQGTMPVVFGIIKRVSSFEEAMRYAVAVGGDSDTIGAIVGSIAEVIWGIPDYMEEKVLEYLPNDMKIILEQFNEVKWDNY